MPALILVGQSITFTSSVSGGYPAYAYQWYFNGNSVSGANATSWTFTPTTAGIYYVYLKVTDAKGNTAQSDAARITVATVPVGGYSYPINKYTLLTPIATHIALIAILTAIFVTIKQKTRRKHR
jgi:PKD repeat protein